MDKIVQGSQFTVHHKPKVVFFGTPKIGGVVLEELIANRLSPIAVITREDKPAGRGQKPAPPPVKLAAEKHHVPVFQPQRLKENQEFFEKLKTLEPDLGIVASYGRIIPRQVLEIPQYGIINLHPSLLPRYRGASPVQSAILSGEKETGVTIILLDEKLDHGPIIAQEKIPIADTDTTESLSGKLAKMGAKLLIKTIPDWLEGKIKPRQQDHQKATLTKMFTKEDGYIDPENPPSPETFDRMVRAFYPWPGVWTRLRRAAGIASGDARQGFGGQAKIIKFLPGNLIQPEGKRPMRIIEFKNGYPPLYNKLRQIIESFE